MNESCIVAAIRKNTSAPVNKDKQEVDTLGSKVVNKDATLTSIKEESKDSDMEGACLFTTNDINTSQDSTMEFANQGLAISDGIASQSSDFDKQDIALVAAVLSQNMTTNTTSSESTTTVKDSMGQVKHCKHKHAYAPSTARLTFFCFISHRRNNSTSINIQHKRSNR